MKREDWLIGILLFLIPVFFISSNRLASFASRFIKVSDIQKFEQDLSKFRYRQRQSILWIATLFILAFLIAHHIGITRISYPAILSAILLTHAAFGQLGWEIQTYNGDSEIETLNKWWFRILYSAGTIFLFLAILLDK